MPRPAAVAAVPLTAADGTSTSTPAAGPAVCRARRRQNSSVDTGTPCLRQKTRKLSSLRSKRSSHLARSFVLHRRCLRMAAFSEIPVDPHRALLPPNKSRLEELSVHWAPECGLALGGDLQCCWVMCMPHAACAGSCRAPDYAERGVSRGDFPRVCQRPIRHSLMASPARSVRRRSHGYGYVHQEAQ